MKFKDCKFNGKRDVRKEVKADISNFLKREIPYTLYNEGLILQYIDLLIDETDYDVRRKQFYYKVNWVKIDISVKLLKNVALEYIKEHRMEFLLEKNMPAQ
jgi:hypothetical protein